MQLADVAFGDVELIGVDPGRRQERDRQSCRQRGQVAPRERDLVDAIAVGRDDLDEEGLVEAVHEIAARALAMAASSSSDGSWAGLNAATDLPYVRVSSRE